MDNNVLLLAPRPTGLPALPWADREIQSIVNSGLRVRMEREDISEQRIIELLADAVAKGDPFDILWFATHGNHDGICLSGSDVLSPEAAASILRDTSIKCVFLNTCNSVYVAATISEEADIPVICTISETIADHQAWRTGTLFANKLSHGLSYTEAFRLSRPVRPGRYIYLPPITSENQQQVEELKIAIANGDEDETRLLLDKIGDHERRIVALETITGDHENRISVNEGKLSPPASVIVMLALIALVAIADAIIVEAILGDEMMRQLVQRIPAVWIGGEVLVLIAISTWTVYAITTWRAYAKGAAKKRGVK